LIKHQIYWINKMKKIVILLSTMLMGCTSLTQTTEEMTVNYEGNTVFFNTKENGSFYYVCQSFNSTDNNEKKLSDLFIYGDKRKYNLHLPSGNHISYASVHTVNGKKLKLKDPKTLFSLSESSSILVDWKKHKRSYLDELLTVEFQLNSPDTIKTFISDCKKFYSIDKNKYEKQQKELRLAEQERVNQIVNTLTAKVVNKKRVKIGGLINLNDVLVFERLSQPEQYKSFLSDKNVAYYADLSDYIVKQQLSNNRYLLVHIADYSGSRHINATPIIIESKNQMFEGIRMGSLYIVYEGVTNYITTYGGTKQAIQLTEL